MFLEITNVGKRIGADDVLSDISLSMEKGKIYGLQGKNGCGKSMLMRVMCGLVLPSVGEIKIDGKILGKDISFPQSVGVFIEKPGFLDSYSGFQNLAMLASIKKIVDGTEVKEVLKRVGLQDVMHKKFRRYSLGMKQKLGIAAAIMEHPDMIILDEPSNALDEKSEERLWQIVREEKNRGALVIISCHAADVLEKVSDEIFKMDMGYINESHIDALEVVNEFGYVTSRQVTQVLELRGKLNDIEVEKRQTKVAKWLEDLTKSKVIARYFFQTLGDGTP